MQTIEIYDTTLRDGAQAEDVSFSVEDKVRITQRLDELGIHYVEGGWPGANPKDTLFFTEIKKVPLKSAQVTAFGSTRKARSPVEKDVTIRALLEAGTSVVTIFGKSWGLHVTEALGISLQKNCELISDSIAYLTSKGRQVFYDAEHFFDGYKADPEYAIKTLKVAEAAGADRIILCDTNGGTLPWEVYGIVSHVVAEIKTPLGIHAHNDCETAVANSLIAVQLGAVQVQGTINGLGERCGNADLCSIIPNLQLKMNKRCLSDGRLRRLVEISRFVSETANLLSDRHQPYVGESAFAHKGGVHVHAVRKVPRTYEHIRPGRVGNRQRILVSDYSGKSSLLEKAREFGIRLTADNPTLSPLLTTLKELEHQGFQFEGAEGSLKVLMKKAMGTYTPFFDLVGFRVIVEKRQGRGDPTSEATLMLKVGGQVEHTAAVGCGPVHALDNALRKALDRFYPELKEIKLHDYKVRVLTTGKGTASQVRVLIASGDQEEEWATVGVSENIIEASWQALVDSIEYKLIKRRV